MSNPLDEFLEVYGETKEANPRGQFGGEFGRALVGGLGAAGAAAAIGGVSLAAGRIYDAATKARDFRAMLSHNEDVRQHHDASPRIVNQYYTTLRTMNPSFAKDPIVAGTYMRKMLDEPRHAGAIAAESVSTRDKFPNFLDRPTEEGMGTAKSHFARPQRPLPPRET